jgi:putative endonuclease
MNGKRYVGISDDLERRLREHQRTGSTVSKLLGSFELLQKEEFLTHGTARIREKFLKSGRGREWLDDRYPPRG